MSAPLTLRRSAATLSQTALKAPSCRAISHSTTPLFQRRCLFAATRALGAEQTRSSAAAVDLTCFKWRHSSPTTVTARSQVRLYSDDSGPSLRQWGFEDINSSLPSTTTSPTHKPVILIDVREPAELSSTGIIPSALSIPLASQPDALYLTPDEFETRFGFPKPAVDAESNLVFYCKAGVRARAAAQLAVQAGYDPEKVGVYEGSWLDWEKRGGKVERWEGDDA